MELKDNGRGKGNKDRSRKEELTKEREQAEDGKLVDVLMYSPLPLGFFCCHCVFGMLTCQQPLENVCRDVYFPDMSVCLPEVSVLNLMGMLFVHLSYCS